MSSSTASSSTKRSRCSSTSYDRRPIGNDLWRRRQGSNLHGLAARGLQAETKRAADQRTIDSSPFPFRELRGVLSSPRIWTPPRTPESASASSCIGTQRMSPPAQPGRFIATIGRYELLECAGVARDVDLPFVAHRRRAYGVGVIVYFCARDSKAGGTECLACRRVALFCRGTGLSWRARRSRSSTFKGTASPVFE